MCYSPLRHRVLPGDYHILPFPAVFASSDIEADARLARQLPLRIRLQRLVAQRATVELEAEARPALRAKLQFLPGGLAQELAV